MMKHLLLVHQLYMEVIKKMYKNKNIGKLFKSIMEDGYEK